jgi:hypothetical protein
MANQKQGSKQGGRDSQRQSTGTPDKDLQRREYRDKEGEVHHHTKKYMEEHEGEQTEESEDTEREED